MTITVVTPEMMELARKALEVNERTKNEDPKVWAERLASDLCKATD